MYDSLFKTKIHISVDFQFYVDIIANVKTEKEEPMGGMTHYPFSKKKKKKILATVAKQHI